MALPSWGNLQPHQPPPHRQLFPVEASARKSFHLNLEQGTGQPLELVRLISDTGFT